MRARKRELTKEDLADLKKGASWQNIYDLLWHIATVRYVTYPQLKAAFPQATWRIKCATPKKLNKLTDKGLISKSQAGIFTATFQTVKFLEKYSDYKTGLIKPAQGQGERDGLHNADVLLKAINLPHFYALFYPDFYEHPRDKQPFLVPDGALVFKKNDKAKLVFLEIEQPKSDWEGYLKDKQWKYELIAGREETWSVWWRQSCKLLGFSQCPVDEFGFEVWCIGAFQADWPGWEFKDHP